MRESKVWLTNYTNTDIDDYRILLIAEGTRLDNNLYNFLKIELTNTKFNKVRTLTNKRSLTMINTYLIRIEKSNYMKNLR